MLSYMRYMVTRHETEIKDGEVEVRNVNIGNVTGSIQPVGYRESSSLPENLRTESKYKLYTRDERLLVNGVISDGTIAIGDEIHTPFGVLRVIGSEAHLREVVSPILRITAHCKYYLAGESGG